MPKNFKERIHITVPQFKEALCPVHRWRKKKKKTKTQHHHTKGPVPVIKKVCGKPET